MADTPAERTPEERAALLCTVAQDEDHGVIDGEDVRG